MVDTNSKDASALSSTVKKSGDWSGGKGIIPGRETIGPLFLMIASPIFSIVFIHTVSTMQGDFREFATLCFNDGFVTTMKNIWPTPFDPLVLKGIGSFMVFELILQKFMPGKQFKASITPTGNVPVYQANGMACYLTTLITLIGLAYAEVIRPAVVYDKFGEFISSMNVFAVLFCFLLYFKGHVAPTNSDSGSNGNLIIDYFWGMELNPRILGWDVKMFTNCRFGMMFWAVGIVCFAHKNIELNDGEIQYGMAVNVLLQLIYISKFFHWEMGYMCSMDIQHDRAGFYICWGCLVWVPSVYTSHSYYLAGNAPAISEAIALAIFVFGCLMVYINWESDNQRYIFRQTNGNCKIWGRTPRKIVAEYTTASGELKKSLLLVDGWWKVSRHFHYMPEILGSLCWGLPALNTALVGPYFYTTFLTILLVDRAYRDDDRCRKKYGIYWEKYCSEVPYMILPFGSVGTSK